MCGRSTVRSIAGKFFLRIEILKNATQPHNPYISVLFGMKGCCYQFTRGTEAIFFLTLR